MIRKLFLVFLFFGILMYSAVGQNSNAYKSEWQVRFNTGANIPLTKYMQDNVTYYLLQYKAYSRLNQLSVSHFFHKHWGVDLNFRAGSNSIIGARYSDFVEKIQSMYGDNYLKNVETSENDKDRSVFRQGYIGIIYRFETNKFYAYPTLSVGGIAMRTNYWQAHLKEKNSNNEYGVYFSTKNKQSNSLFFSISPSVSLGYKLSKRVFLNSDIMLSYFRPNFTFEKEFVNLYTKESSVEYFDYKKGIFTLGLGVGLIFVIR